MKGKQALGKAVVEVLGGIALAGLLLEIVFRLRMLWFSPWGVKLAFAFFMLRRRRLAENNVINQRIIRGGFRSEAELFAHYAEISGASESHIYTKFGRERSWFWWLSGEYYSGGHAVLSLSARMHTGIVAKPIQRLQTLEINEEGLRRSGWEKPPEQVGKSDKVCLLLGGSTMFGLGATSDESTIAGRLGHYLNLHSDSEYVVINNAMLGYNSHQELLALLQSKYRPDYVIALSGYNELLQFSDGYDKVAVAAKHCDRDLAMTVGGAVKVIFSNLMMRSVLLSEIRRFMAAFCHSDGVQDRTEDPDPDVSIYPMR